MQLTGLWCMMIRADVCPLVDILAGCFGLERLWGLSPLTKLSPANLSLSHTLNHSLPHNTHIHTLSHTTHTYTYTDTAQNLQAGHVS